MSQHPDLLCRWKEPNFQSTLVGKSTCLSNTAFVHWNPEIILESHSIFFQWRCHSSPLLYLKNSATGIISYSKQFSKFKNKFIHQMTLPILDNLMQVLFSYFVPSANNSSRCLTLKISSPAEIFVAEVKNQIHSKEMMTKIRRWKPNQSNYKLCMGTISMMDFFRTFRFFQLHICFSLFRFPFLVFVSSMNFLLLKMVWQPFFYLRIKSK